MDPGSAAATVANVRGSQRGLAELRDMPEQHTDDKEDVVKDMKDDITGGWRNLQPHLYVPTTMGSVVCMARRARSGDLVRNGPKNPTGCLGENTPGMCTIHVLVLHPV